MALERARSVITGAGSGLGRAFALELAAGKGVLLLSDIDAKGLEETARLARERGATDVVTTSCDVRRAGDVEALAKLADERFGGVDVVVNNAGVGVAGPVGDVPLEDWQWVVDVNLWGVIHGCHVFVPRLKRQRSGYLINIASAAGLISTPEMAPYNVTKAAVVALSETLAAELRGTGVNVTVVCPTFFETKIMDSGRFTGAPDADRLARAMMKRSRVQADGVAKAALRSAKKGELYCVPMADGRAMWRMKRLAPERMPAVMGLGKKAGGKLGG